MSQFEIFIFGCMNFAGLMAIIAWSLRKVVRQFLYARRANLKKQMVVAAHERRQARARLAKAREEADSVSEDIERRRRVMAESCVAECDGIIEEARRQASRIMESAGRQIVEERARAASNVRKRILEKAFARAEEMVRGGMTDAARRDALDAGLSELRVAVADEKGREYFGGER
ncbi:MAG TPA: ATP synthase F0 subunit B [bacterium]|nr:ATP synthase F0 subunit B [bacterium]